VRLASEREELRVVADQIGAPTSARAIADGTARILARGAGAAGFAFEPRQLGTFHLTAGGETSWHGFARAILDAWPDPALRSRRLLPITTAEFPRPARRPAYSVLDPGRVDAAFGVRLAHWQDQLARVLAEGSGRDHSARATQELD
jgi:dTDP-4-dehydrorhamnose reductase